MLDKRFSEKIIPWYLNNKRDLPWRATQDPYKIWLSEVILQQTRVNQGLPYYYKFVENFPDIASLAAASEQNVLRLWQGLGYYSRARNLHKCAKILVDKYEGRFPNSYSELLKLPGIGKYTAAAIASFAYNECVPVVDGNVYRVLSRIFGIQDDIADGNGQKTFQELSADLISKHQPEIYNQAIMEFGALQCTPKSPDCSNCIFNLECFARNNEMQRQLPVKSKKVKVRNRFFYYVIFKHDQRFLMKPRKNGDIWQGLYDFYLIEKDVQTDFELMLEDELKILKNTQILNIDVSDAYKHVLTHQRISAVFILVSLKSFPSELINEDFTFYSKEEIKKLPKPVLISRYLNEAIF